ncbi:MAG: hypothetical protein NC131_15725 [Roseburia sp.]|nr:hypothetical protein [Roseburia sp.]
MPIVTVTVLIILCMSFAVTVGIFLYKLIKWILSKRKRFNYDKNDAFLMRVCHQSNILIEGEMGSCKDLLMAHIAHMQGFHYSNIRYDGNTEVRELSDLSLGDNTFNDLVNGTIRKIPPAFEEGTLFLVSDAGIYFPSQWDKLLDSLYPSIPLFAALCRQLYEMRIVYNTQNVERLWKKLREQVGGFFHVLGHRNMGEYMIVRTIYYSNYEQCKACILPEDNHKRYVCEYMNFKIYKSELLYDSRVFKSKCLECDDESEYEKLLKGIYNEEYMEVIRNV